MKHKILCKLGKSLDQAMIGFIAVFFFFQDEMIDRFHNQNKR